MTGREIMFLKCSKKHQVKIIKNLLHAPKNFADADIATYGNSFRGEAPKPLVGSLLRAGIQGKLSQGSGHSSGLRRQEAGHRCGCRVAAALLWHERDDPELRQLN